MSALDKNLEPCLQLWRIFFTNFGWRSNLKKRRGPIDLHTWIIASLVKFPSLYFCLFLQLTPSHMDSIPDELLMLSNVADSFEEENESLEDDEGTEEEIWLPSEDDLDKRGRSRRRNLWYVPRPRKIFTHRDLKGMKRNQLLGICKRRRVSLRRGFTKADMQRLILKDQREQAILCWRLDKMLKWDGCEICRM